MQLISEIIRSHSTPYRSIFRSFPVAPKSLHEASHLGRHWEDRATIHRHQLDKAEEK